MYGFGSSATANGTAINHGIFPNSEQSAEISKGLFTSPSAGP